MTCRDYESSLLDRARGVLAPEAARALEEHLRHCQACAARLDGEIALTADLRALAAATAGMGPSECLEETLLEQFSSHSRPRAGATMKASEVAAPAAAARPAARWRGWLAAAAAVLVMAGAAAAWRLVLRPATDQAGGRVSSALPATRSFGPTAIAARLVSLPRERPVGTAAASRGPAVDRRSSRASASGSVRRADQAVQFVAWPGAAALPPLESGEVLRTDLPASVLPLLGLQQPAPARSRVPADIIVGQDGMARAVRVVFER